MSPNALVIGFVPAIKSPFVVATKLRCDRGTDWSLSAPAKESCVVPAISYAPVPVTQYLRVAAWDILLEEELEECAPVCR
jgi:hypothetical protein